MSNLVKVQWFHFRQNNSGGHMTVDADVDRSVWVEATNAQHANDRAREVGLYFHGCASGRDCSCCGDRWSPIWDGEEGVERPTEGAFMANRPRGKTWASFGLLETPERTAETIAVLYHADGRRTYASLNPNDELPQEDTDDFESE